MIYKEVKCNLNMIFINEGSIIGRLIIYTLGFKRRFIYIETILLNK